MTGWHRDYDPCVWRNRATVPQRGEVWEMWVLMDKVIAKVLHEAHERQLEETMRTLEDGPEKFYEAGRG